MLDKFLFGVPCDVASLMLQTDITLLLFILDYLCFCGWNTVLFLLIETFQTEIVGRLPSLFHCWSGQCGFKADAKDQNCLERAGCSVDGQEHHDEEGHQRAH